MDNSSVLPNSTTQALSSPSKLTDYVRGSIIFLIILSLIFFIYFVTVMLSAFSVAPQLQQNARYVLFVYMLINDTFYVLMAFFLLLGAICFLSVPVPVCYVLYTVSSMAFRVTPYNLAAMALEQYVAICYPLRHAQLCTPQRANVAFTMICSVLMIPYAAELFVIVSFHTNIFNVYVVCRQNMLLVSPVQNLIRSLNLILCFSLVGLVIIFTYVKIMLVALKISSKSSSAAKAGKTVMLHAFQLLLCMASLLSILAEAFSENQMDLFPISSFFAFTCVPRFLSPIIYGIRDEVLRKHFKKSLPKRCR